MSRAMKSSQFGTTKVNFMLCVELAPQHTVRLFSDSLTGDEVCPSLQTVSMLRPFF